MNSRPILAVTVALSLYLPLSSYAAELDARTFATKAAQSDMFEHAAAELVIEKGHADHVKTFARDMVRDHGKSTQGLREAAASDGVSLPETMGPELEEKLAALKPLSGPQLDAAYVSTQVSVHTEAAELFDAYAMDGPSEALKNFAMKTYPTIRMHLLRIRGFNIE